MATQLELILEAEKRGLPIPENKQALLTEARKRGLIPSLSLEALTPEQRKVAEERIETTEQAGIEIGKRKLLEEGPETAGGIIGGIVGGVIGKTPTTVRAGAAGGAFVGGAAGKTASQLLLGEKLEPTEIAKAGGKQVAFELGGQAITGIAQKVLAPFAKTVTPEAIAAKETLDKFTPRNTISVLPAEATETRTLDIMQNVAENSIFGGKAIADFKNITRPRTIDNMIDDLVGRFGEQVEPDVLGEAVEAIVSGKLKASRIPAQTIYNTISERLIAKGDIISTKSLKDFATPLAEKAQKLGGISGANTGDDIIRGIMELPDNIDYATAQELRSRLISKADEFLIINKKAPAIGRAKKLASLTDSAIEKSLKIEDKVALTKWREANKIWQSTSEQFNNKFIRGLIKEAATKNNPELIASKIFKPRGISNIRKIKRAVDEDTFQQLKRWHVDSLLKQSADKEGQLVGNTFFNKMFGKGGMGEQTMKEIYNPQELRALKDSANAMKIIQKKQGEGAGSMWIQLAQPTALIGLIDERSRPFSIAVLGGPAVLARLMTHPQGARWLTQGAKLPAKSPQALSIIAKLSDLAIRLRQETGERLTSGRLQDLTEERPEGIQSTLGDQNAL